MDKFKFITLYIFEGNMATTFMVASSVFAEVWRLGIFWLAAITTFLLLYVMIITIIITATVTIVSIIW